MKPMEGTSFIRKKALYIFEKIDFISMNTYRVFLSFFWLVSRI